MTVEAALYARMTAHAGLSALVATRVYPVVAPQDVIYPCVVYTRVSTIRENAMGADPGIVRARVQVSAWATSHLGAHNVAAEVRSALQRWRGTAGGTVVQDTLFTGESDTYSDVAELFEVAAEFEIIAEE